jgi:hypothetical protein
MRVRLGVMLLVIGIGILMVAAIEMIRLTVSTCRMFKRGSGNGSDQQGAS